MSDDAETERQFLAESGKIFSSKPKSLPNHKKSRVTQKAQSGATSRTSRDSQMRRNPFGRAPDAEIWGISLRIPPPIPPVMVPRFSGNTAKQQKPATVHFAAKPCDSMGKSESSSILKVSETVGNENAPKNRRMWRKSRRCE